jgi:hypothetical protein
MNVLNFSDQKQQLGIFVPTNAQGVYFVIPIAQPHHP